MFEELLTLKTQVDTFLREAKVLLESVREACDEMRKESAELKERVMELHGAHETILGFVADCDDEAAEVLADTAVTAAQTAAEASATAVAAAATVEEAAATVAAAVEETLPEVETVTETKPVEEKPAEEKPAEKPAEEKPAETPVPAESAAPAQAAAPEAKRRRHFI
jgi:outer membrane biosynthesis protein TonB